jgi:uncharacterized protein (TIGR02246 family)
MSGIERAVAAVLASYEDALNASDTDAVMPLYADDGVFMAPFSHSAIAEMRYAKRTMQCLAQSLST